MQALSAAPPAHLLVATDLSEEAGRALDRAARLATVHHARLTAVHALPGHADEAAVAAATARLRAHVDRFAGEHCEDIVVRAGDTNSVIVDEAAARAADLLLVGARGARPVARALLGGTAETLVRSSRIPVLVVKNVPARDYRRVVLAVDSSSVAANAARAGTMLTLGAEHALVHASLPGPRRTRVRTADPESIHRHLARLSQSLARAPERTLVAAGPPRRRITEAATELTADLIVLGGGRHSRLGYALLGSTGQGVLRDAGADVLLVPDTPDRR
ncbi:universal stress protein [Nocardia sp. SSK8]|uniref:universal stress protein n=1 Tax=Nocardia sp. SSK8 TaxID=3120154 RepID=UPI00300AB28F